MPEALSVYPPSGTAIPQPTSWGGSAIGIQTGAQKSKQAVGWVSMENVKIIVIALALVTRFGRRLFSHNFPVPVYLFLFRKWNEEGSEVVARVNSLYLFLLLEHALQQWLSVNLGVSAEIDANPLAACVEGKSQYLQESEERKQRKKGVFGNEKA